MSAWWPRALGWYLLRHPVDAVAVGVSAWALRRNHWWRRPPFLPLPDAAYWRFRLATYDGSPTARLEPRAVVDAAKWSRLQRNAR